MVDEQARPIPRFEIDGEVMLNADGRFASSYPHRSVRIAAWGFEPLDREVESADLGTVVLRREKPLEVLVLGPDAGPLAAEVMSAAEPPVSAITSLRKSELDARGSSDQTGRARVFVPPEACVLAARFPYVPSDCVVPDGGPLTLQLTTPGAIEGTAIGKFLVPGTGRAEAGDGEGATYVENGHFRFWPLSPGRHRLLVQMPSGAIWHRAIDVDAGATTEVSLSENEGSELRVVVDADASEELWVVVTQADERVERFGFVDPQTLQWNVSIPGLREGRAEVLVARGKVERKQTVFLSSTPHEVKVRFGP